jgi:hypothetical protein
MPGASTPRLSSPQPINAVAVIATTPNPRFHRVVVPRAARSISNSREHGVLRLVMFLRILTTHYPLTALVSPDCSAVEAPTCSSRWVSGASQGAATPQLWACSWQGLRIF